MKSQKTPLRMCVGCGEMKPKRELVRVVKTQNGEILLDKTGKQNGRGAYICDDAKCLSLAQKARRLEKAFGTAIPNEVYEGLSEVLSNDR